MAKKGCNIYVTKYCDRLGNAPFNCFEFLNWSQSPPFEISLGCARGASKFCFFVEYKKKTGCNP